MKRALLLSALIVWAAEARALGSAANGTTAAEFLSLRVGARAVAMGGAYSAVADDATALYWNPAGLTGIARRSAAFMHAAYLGSSYFDYASYGQNLGASGAVAAGIQYFSAGPIARTDASGTSAGSFTPYDLALSAGYAYRFPGGSWGPLGGFSAGAALKFIEAKVATTARAEALDLGALSPGYLDGRLRAAAVLTNLGGTLKHDATGEKLPLEWRVGAVYRIARPWSASVDLILPRGGAAYLGMGTEYMVFQDVSWSFAGRAGFDTQTLPGVDGFSGPSFGFGCGHGRGSVDYAFVPLGGLGQAHRLSLSARF